MTAIAIPDRYRELALRCRTDFPVLVVARALWHYETELQTMVVDIAAEASTTQTTLNKWVAQAGIPSRRVLSYEQYAEQAGQLYDSYGNLAAVAAELGVNVQTIKRAVLSTGREVNAQPAAIREALSTVYAADPGWMTVREAAAVTGMNRTTMSRMCREGRVPGAKLEPVKPGTTKLRWLVPQRWADQRAVARPAVSGKPTYLTARPLIEWLALQVFDQYELSAKSGVPERRIYGLRKGENTYVDLGTADRLTAAFGARLDDVWDDPDADLKAATHAFRNQLRDALDRGRAAQAAAREQAAA